MAIHAAGQAVILGLSIPWTSFPTLFGEFLRRYPDTLALELSGRQLVASGFAESEIRPFVTAVCRWGGYAGIGGRVLTQNSISSIRAAVVQAEENLHSSPADCRQALTAMNQLHSLGTPSFASKHLRFLRPELCPVYDAILRDVLPYSYDPDGYEEFASDCLAIAGMLHDRRIDNPAGRLDRAWYAADVEAALFAHVNGWVP